MEVLQSQELFDINMHTKESYDGDLPDLIQQYYSATSAALVGMMCR